MKYRFKNTYRQFRIGDAVPETFGSGVIDALARRHIVEPVEEKEVSAPDECKMITPSETKHKRRKAIV